MLTAAQITALGNHAPVEQLALRLHQKVGLVKAVWNYAVDGGAVGHNYLSDDQGNPVIFPNDTIIKQLYIHVVTLPVSASNNGTVALTLNTTGDVLVAIDPDATNWGASDTIRAGVPLGSAATMMVTTAERRLDMEIATNAFSAGRIHFFLEYALSAV